VLAIVVEGQRFDVEQSDEVVKSENCFTLRGYLRFQTGKNSVSTAGQIRIQS